MKHNEAKSAHRLMKIIAGIAILVLAHSLGGCATNPQAERLIPAFTIQHIDGFPVTVHHMGSSLHKIGQVCGSKEFKVTGGGSNAKGRTYVRADNLGCVMYVPTKDNPNCYVYSPGPGSLGHYTWLHEVGATPEGNSPVFGHCEGMTHDRESETF